MSSVSETGVVADLTQKEFEVFTQVSGKSSFDLVAYKNGKIYRIQVKSCRKIDKKGRSKVQLKSVRHNKKENKIIPFDPTSCDLLAVYLFNYSNGEDRIYYFDPLKLKSLNELVLDPLLDWVGLVHLNR